MREPLAKERSEGRRRGGDNGEVRLDGRRAEAEGVGWVGTWGREVTLVDEPETDGTNDGNTEVKVLAFWPTRNMVGSSRLT